MAFVSVASLGQLEDGELLAVKVGALSLCLARVDGEVYAFTDNCSHRDFPLSGGDFDPEECSVTCDWHGARFNVISGEVLSLPATQALRVYPCRVEGEEILVDVG